MEVQMCLDFDFEAVDIWMSIAKLRCLETQNSYTSNVLVLFYYGGAEVTIQFN